MKINTIVVACAAACCASAEPTRSWGTVDSFGLLRWERFSSNPAVGTIVAALAKSETTLADLRSADLAVGKKPDDLPSRALRAELRLRVNDTLGPPTAPKFEQLVRLKKPDRFELSYAYYHWRRTKFPERYGITSDLSKATPPFSMFNQNDLVSNEISSGLNDLSWEETLLLIDWSIRRGMEEGRRTQEAAFDRKPKLWELEALRVPLLRCGGYTLTGAYPGVAQVRLKQFPKALVLVQRLRREHPECRVLDQMAGVAAMDLKRYELARAYFNAYLAQPDSGVQGERRSRDVRELLTKLPK